MFFDSSSPRYHAGETPAVPGISGASKNATPLFPRQAHTVFRTPNTDDWTGGVARPQPPAFGFLSANRRAQILTT